MPKHKFSVALTHEDVILGVECVKCGLRVWVEKGIIPPEKVAEECPGKAARKGSEK